MLRRLALRLTLTTAVVAAVTVFVPAGSGAAPTQYTVNVVNNHFGEIPDNNQNPVHIEVGDTVVWHNLDPVDHTVTLDNAGSGAALPAGGTFASAPFDTPGTYGYHCDIHPDMKGTIEVAAPATTTTSSTTTTTSSTTTTTEPSSTTTTTRPDTTTTTRPGTTTTTTHATTTTTQPGGSVSAVPNTPTTSGPTTTTGTPATTGAPGTTAPKPKGNDTTTTGKPKNETAVPAAPAAPAPLGDDGFAAGIFKPAPTPAAAAKPTVDVNGAPIVPAEQKPAQHGTLAMLLAGIALVLFGVSLVGYKWWNRDSKYMPA